jgi:hypothetical protein
MLDTLKINKFEAKSLLTENSCNNIYSIIESINPAFLVSRGLGLETLGGASYLDIPHPTARKYYNANATGGNLSSYIIKANQENPLLLNNFAKLYEIICDFFSKQFKVKCSLHQIAAVPGFHIHANHPSYSSQSSHIPHFDAQYEMLYPLFADSSKQISFMGKTISFTLPIKLPGCQSGIRFWDLHYQDVLNKNTSTITSELLKMKPYTLQYQVGDIVFHSGHYLHQIKAWTTNIKDSPRVTLQGHGLFHNDQLYLYW